jgi:hypothetical protein
MAQSIEKRFPKGGGCLRLNEEKPMVKGDDDVEVVFFLV